MVFALGQFSPMRSPAPQSPWLWVPSLYFAEGLPYALVASVSVVAYKNLGVSNDIVTLSANLLCLPWMFKPLWSPVVDLIRTRRQWVWACQMIMALSLLCLALAVESSHFLILSLVGMALLSLTSATHDMAADGFYLVTLPEWQQAAFSGVRNTAYRAAGMAAQAGLVMMAGALYQHGGSYQSAWAIALGSCALIMFLLASYHHFQLPYPSGDRPGSHAIGMPWLPDFLNVLGSFFRKRRILIMLAFLLFYRFGEAQLAPVSRLFLLDAPDNGGLGLTDPQYSRIYGLWGLAALLGGGLLGGWLISRHGLRRWLWPMVLALHVPDGLFLWLACAKPSSLLLITLGVSVEQFGYGFGFAAYMMYMLHMARGRHSTAHYALCTGFMAAGLLIPGLWSGWLQLRLGYPLFFAWVLLATIPGFVVAACLSVPRNLGRRSPIR